jgi:hypothetical protein
VYQQCASTMQLIHCQATQANKHVKLQVHEDWASSTRQWYLFALIRTHPPTLPDLSLVHRSLMVTTPSKGGSPMAL